jgi:hypothetical protein
LLLFGNSGRLSHPSFERSSIQAPGTEKTLTSYTRVFHVEQNN